MAKRGVDLDGCLAEQNWKDYHSDYDPTKIGEPIPLMAERVRYWLSIGDEVDIFTARMNPTDEFKDSVPAFTEAFTIWSMKHFGIVLKLTCTKDSHWAEIYDDKAVRVIKNTGMISDGTDVDRFFQPQAIGL